SEAGRPCACARHIPAFGLSIRMDQDIVFGAVPAGCHVALPVTALRGGVPELLCLHGQCFGWSSACAVSIGGGQTRYPVLVREPGSNARKFILDSNSRRNPGEINSKRERDERAQRGHFHSRKRRWAD